VKTATEEKVSSTKMFPINTEITQVDVIFPARVSHLMPAWSDIPEDYKNGRKPSCDIFSRWFFSGLPKGTQFIPREGVDVTKALAHLKCILGSFEPKHEHKEASVAFLLDEWFSEVKIPEGDSK
jgi:hypothetical protein